MAKVLLQNVTKKYGDSVAVNELNLLVRDSEFLVLVGPSGCGKTSVLRMIAGLEQVTSGVIYIGERIVNNLSPRERNVAMVFESPTFGLYPHMTAYENMSFGLRIHKESGIKERVEGVARKLHMGQFMQRKQHQLSSGQSQSLALGRSLVKQPDLFLMDDPLSQIDAHNRDAQRMEIRREHREHGTTTIYVTHEQQDAMALGDRIAVMNEGTLQQIGTPQGVYDHPANAFVARFIGSPAMNILQADFELENTKGQGTETFLRGAGFRVRVPDEFARRLSSFEGRSILLGLRPEAVKDPHHVANPDPNALVGGQVTAREYTGQDVFLHLLVGGQEIVARMDERTNAGPPDNFTVLFDMEQMHAFDPRTEQTLL